MPRVAWTFLAALFLSLPAFAQGGLQPVPIGGGFEEPETTPEVVTGVAVRDASVAPGEETVIAVVLDHAEHWHTYPVEKTGPEDIISLLISATATPEPADGLTFGDPRWPAAHEIEIPPALGGGDQKLGVNEGRTVALIPVTVAGSVSAGAEIPVVVAVEYQACDDRLCLAPETVFHRVIVRVGESTEAAEHADLQAYFGEPRMVAHADVLFEAALPESWTTTFDPYAEAGEADAADEAAPVATGVAFSFFGLSVSGGMALALILPLSFVGGLILNLTPCVLPVLPLKVMTLSQHGGENRMRTFVLGVWMALGVTAFWLALGLPAALVSSFLDPSQIFGLWYVTIPIGVIIVAMSLGLMGMFAINLPQSVYMVNPKADNASGSLMFGVMTGVLGLPCFGFVAGALVPAAASFHPLMVIAVFTALGAGMASPYLFLAAFPKLVDKLPRTGPASELVKQFLGLVLIGAGIFFIGTGLLALVATYPAIEDAIAGVIELEYFRVLHYIPVSIAILAAGGWLAYQTFKITAKPVNRTVFGATGLLVAVVGVGLSVNAVMAASHARDSGWVDYSAAALEEAVDDGYAVFIDVTAEWCINCKFFERTVLDVDPVRSRLESRDVVMMKVDMTGRNPEGQALLRELELVGQPQWIAFGEGLTDGHEVLVPGNGPQVLDVLDRASTRQAAGEAVAAGG